MLAHGCRPVHAGALLVVLPMLLVAQTAPAEAAKAEPGTQRGADVVQTGWWSRTNEPVPETGLLAPPNVPAAGAPAGTLPVAVAGGERERIAAVELKLAGKPDGTVDQLQLALRESEEPGSQLNPELAMITACPVTETFWVGGENGTWKNQPEFDCDALSVPGERDKNGVWTFDLTFLAADWLATNRSSSTSVVLVGEEAGDTGEPLSFQVAFDGDKTKGIGLLASTSAPAVTAPIAPAPSGVDVPATAASGAAVGGGVSGGGVGSVPPGGAAAPGAPVTAAGAQPAPETAAASDQPVQPVAAPQLPWHAGLGKPVFLLLPLVLVLAYLLMLANGPMAQPAGVSGRRRGVSRALDRMRQAGAQVRVGGLTGKGTR
jgi:hypothetical protein